MNRSRAEPLGLLSLVCLAAACAATGSGDQAPVEFSAVTPPLAGDELPHWPIRPEVAERLFHVDAPREFQVLEIEGAGAGVTGAKRQRVRLESVPEGREFMVKWKPFPPGRLDGPNNSPRREIAAYEIQKLFLAPESYVVPTSTLRCTPLERVHEMRQDLPASLPGTRCVLGLFSLWIEDVRVPDALYEPERFYADPVYAHFIADFNLLTYLIRHRDGRAGNFLVSTDESRRQVFAVDNGIAFSGMIYNYFVPNWDVIRVPALRRTSLEQLRRLERGDLDRFAVIYQLQRGADGQLHGVTPGPDLDPDAGVSVEGDTVQIGLTRREIDQVWDRIQRVLKRVDSGEIQTF
jgi:hypothetical protein